MASTSSTPPRGSILSQISTYFYRRPTALLLVLLGPPLLWLGVVYLGALFMLVVRSCQMPHFQWMQLVVDYS